jgi:hypothetical protein
MIQPQNIHISDWGGLFGMCEMESVAKVILAEAQKAGRWIPVYLQMCEDDHTRTGFVELLYCGWLDKGSGEPWCYNGGFLPTAGFVNRLEQRSRKEGRIKV